MTFGPLLTPTRVYFVGIGGVGMSALAQLFAARGMVVSGSDREVSPTTTMLEAKGIAVSIGQCAENVPTDATLVVYSDAVPEENVERARARARGIREQSYFSALGDVSKEFFTIAVAGSHGKTTTTALLGAALAHVGVNPTVIVGSIVKEFESNFRLGASAAPLVVEACEYRDHLLELSPHILVVTNVEWDHTDYFTTFEQLQETFIAAVKKLPPDGALVVNLDTTAGALLASHAPCRVVNSASVAVPELRLLGEFNRHNAQTAKAAIHAFDATLPEHRLDEALAHFRGTWRRFEYRGTAPGGALVYDDYAHHPTEVKTTLDAVRKKFPEKKIIVAFHPHLYSRTRDLLNDFIHAFGSADVVIVAPIYAAREAPILGITHETLVARLKDVGVSAVSAESLDDTLMLLKKFDQPDSLLITMGAGDIYTITKKLL